MDAQFLSWIITAVGITGFFLAGKKVWWSWYVNLGCQAIWYAYAFVSGQPAFFVAASFYSVVFGMNAYKWTKEHRATAKVLREMRENETGAITLPSGVKVIYETIKEDGESIRHARTELKRIGEDPDVIDWYLNVIREYHTFGHSGGSHMAILPTLYKLLNFEPLTPLTNAPEEWYFHGEDVWGESGGVWQNRRDGRMFSKDGGLTYTNVDDPKDDQPVYCSQVTHPVPA